MAQKRALQRLSALSAQLTGTSSRGVNGSIVKRRWNSSAEAGENKTGHIKTSSTESIVFFNNILPINLQWIFRIPWTLE